MKDKLVFVKIKGKGNCGDCCFYGGEKDACDVLERKGLLNTAKCERMFHYELKEIKEEPVKIQNEYELIKQAFDILNEIGGSHTYNSRVELKAYIEDNKPTNFQQCTRENTKVGDIVRYKKSNEGEMCIVKYIYCGSVSRMVINSNSEEDSAHLSDFEIDLNNTEE